MALFIKFTNILSPSNHLNLTDGYVIVFWFICATAISIFVRPELAYEESVVTCNACHTPV